jgi:hypothetical protein
MAFFSIPGLASGGLRSSADGQEIEKRAFNSRVRIAHHFQKVSFAGEKNAM